MRISTGGMLPPGADAVVMIEHTDAAGQLETDLKTGRGGIRDVEFVLQFLQLLNGARRTELRDRNTLEGLKKLAK